jgi:hypothetical protein
MGLNPISTEQEVSSYSIELGTIMEEMATTKV